MRKKNKQIQHQKRGAFFALKNTPTRVVSNVDKTATQRRKKSRLYNKQKKNTNFAECRRK
jgi:hypothetical protein